MVLGIFAITTNDSATPKSNGIHRFYNNIEASANFFILQVILLTGCIKKILSGNPDRSEQRAWKSTGSLNTA